MVDLQGMSRDRSRGKTAADKTRQHERLQKFVKNLVRDHAERFQHYGFDLALESPHDRYTFLEADYLPRYDGGRGSDPMFGPEEAVPGVSVPNVVSAAFRLECADGNTVFIVKRQEIEKDSACSPISSYGGWRSGNPRHFKVVATGSNPEYYVLIVPGTKNPIDDRFEGGFNRHAYRYVKTLLDSEKVSRKVMQSWATLAKDCYQTLSGPMAKTRRTHIQTLRQLFGEAFKGYPESWLENGTRKSTRIADPIEYSHGKAILIDVPLNGEFKSYYLRLELRREWDSVGRVVTGEEFSMSTTISSGTNERVPTEIEGAFKEALSLVKGARVSARDLYRRANRKKS